MKKIILGGLILSSLIMGFTQAINFAPNETTTINGVSITCDTNANCITEYNGDSFKGIANNPNRNQEGQVIFWREDGYIGYLRGNTRGAGSVRQAYQNAGCFANYTSATNYTTTVLDYLSGGCSQSTGSWLTRIENNGQYAGKITSYTMNFDASQGIICYNYNEELGSFCYYFTSTSGRMPDANYGITFPVTTTKLNSLAIYDSPFISSGPDTEGGPISCINIKTQIMLYGNNYNTGMCYTDGLYFSGFTPIQTGKLSIFEIFPSYQDYQNMTNRYNTYCHAPYTQEYCTQAMSGYEEGMDFFTYIENANNNNVFTVEAEKLYQYCHLQLNFTEEEKRSECKDTVDNYYATGVSEEASNGNPFEGITDRLEDNVQIAVPTTGTVFDEFLDGDTRVVGITDRYGNFKEIYHKIMGLFKYRNTQQGIIPGYITAMIMLILLLAIFKK